MGRRKRELKEKKKFEKYYPVVKNPFQDRVENELRALGREFKDDELADQVIKRINRRD